MSTTPKKRKQTNRKIKNTEYQKINTGKLKIKKPEYHKINAGKLEDEYKAKYNRNIAEKYREVSHPEESQA
jgi:hypothetical protein